jgi:tetratricopeptide (TPR) repeat protein
VAPTTPLSPAVLEKTDAILWKARAAADAGNYEQAIELALDAWDAVPEPKYGSDRTYMFLFALFRFGRLSERRQELIEIINGYLNSGFYRATEDGPYFWLGALRFEEGQFDQAMVDLHRAVQMSRGRCFREEDPRYKQFYEDRRKGIASPQTN